MHDSTKSKQKMEVYINETGSLDENMEEAHGIAI
jgi:hypothetical protein